MLIDRHGLPQHDPWHYLACDETPSFSPSTVVHPPQWNDYHMRFGLPAQGLWLAGDQALEEVQAVLGQLTLIVVEFAKSRDGRGFTLARLLRERHGFTGDLRAAGPLLPDQFAMLMQCGFSSVLVSPAIPLVRWQEAAVAIQHARPRTLLERLSQPNEV